MKICIDAREFVRGRKTGIARYLENLLVPMADSSDFNLTLFVNSESDLPEPLSECRSVELPSIPTLVVDQVILPRLTEKEEADVFFSPYYKLPLNGSFKRIMTVHDIMFLRLDSSSWAKKAARRMQLKKSTDKADLVLVDSEFSRKDLIDFLPGTESKIKVLYPSLEEQWKKSSAPGAKQHLKLKHDLNKPFLLYVGNFKPHKNVELLVRSFAALKNNEYKLVLAGGGPDESVEREVKESGADVTILKGVPEDDLRTLYQAADFFITLSEYEGFGYPALEAMASGCPVICHPCTSIPEVTAGHAVPVNELTEESAAESISSALKMSDDQKFEQTRKARLHSENFIGKAASKEFQNHLLSPELRS